MILTVTMNPSVDISYRLDTLNINDVNRTSEALKTAGGKGINVARVATQLGQKTTATGLLGGHLGAYLMEQLEVDDIQHDFLKIDQESRNCIAILHDGQQTEILESGPTISKEETDQFLTHFKQMLKSGDYQVVTISGSLPTGMDVAVYREMIQFGNDLNIPVILDTSGSNLATVLDDESIHLKAVKPNLDELSAIEDLTVTNDFTVIKEVLASDRYSRVEWVIISLGGDGAFIKHNNMYYRVRVPEIEVVNAVGSGDATVAGLALSVLNQTTDVDLIKTAMTAGVLNTLNEKTGSIEASLFEYIYNQIQITEL